MKWPDDFINKIICGDCLEVMREMPDECVDLVIADPPFNLGKNFGDFDDKKPEQEYWDWLKLRLKEIYRVSNEGSRFYIFHNDKKVFKLKPICESMGFKFHQVLIWYAPNFIAPWRVQGDWSYMHETILLFYKGKRTKMLLQPKHISSSSVQVHVRPQSNFKGGRDHPTQKPISLYAAIIGRTPGKIMLDPFLGIGGSLVAAKNLKRTFIGIETNPDYCKIAEELLTQGVL